MTQEMLFEHEEIRYASGFSSLVRFFKGDPEKPLIVLFPGWALLARIFYGAPEMDEKDFLAYWPLAEGYSVLSVSYPIDHQVYKEVYPGFTITDWGNLASELATEFINENGLIHEVIAVHWSASGQVVRPFNKACTQRGINVRFALTLEATPAEPQKIRGFSPFQNIPLFALLRGILLKRPTTLLSTGAPGAS